MRNQILSCVLFCGITSSVFASAPTNSQTSTPDLTDKIGQFQTWMDNHPVEDIVNALQRFDLDEVSQWLDSQSKTISQIENLEEQIKSDELLLSEKRKSLGDIQSKINLIRLTPVQIAAVEKYNQSLKQDPYFSQWITERSTWFEVGKELFISAGFLWLGIFIESKRKKRKCRTSN